MPPHSNLLKRKRPSGDGSRTQKARPRKFKKQESYHSSSSEDETGPIQNDGLIKQINEEIDGESDGSDVDEGGVQLPTLFKNGDTLQSVPKSNGIPKRLPTADEKRKLRPYEDGHSDSEPLDSSDGDEDEEDEGEELEEDEEGALSGADSDSDLASTSTGTRALRKRNDPSVLATSISKILNSKLTSAQRSDPVLARSRAASETSRKLADSKLEARARRKMKEDKRELNEKGREKDLLGLNREDVETGAVVEKEKQLRRTAQKGVVKLFNAVRAAQVKSEEEERRIRGEGMIGMDARKERVEEMGKKAFLELLAEGGA